MHGAGRPSARATAWNKPFNYHWDGKTFVFASELHAVLALPWVPEILNEGMLAEFLANEWYSRDETFWQGILRLVAAHRMLVRCGWPRLQLYWEPRATSPYTKEEDHIENYRQLFIDVVRRMSRSCKPLACEVSGGLDLRDFAWPSISAGTRRSWRLVWKATLWSSLTIQMPMN